MIELLRWMIQLSSNNYHQTLTQHHPTRCIRHTSLHGLRRFPTPEIDIVVGHSARTATTASVMVATGIFYFSKIHISLELGSDGDISGDGDTVGEPKSQWRQVVTLPLANATSPWKDCNADCIGSDGNDSARHNVTDGTSISLQRNGCW